MNRPGSSRNEERRGAALVRPIVAMVTDRRLYADVATPATEDDVSAAIAAAAGRAASAGVGLVQIRERLLEVASLLSLAAMIRSSIDGTGARMLVNERIDVALAADADGVHLPADAPSCARARAIVPESFLVGRSVHSLQEAVSAEEQGGCDYLIFGTVFESRSKPAGHPVAGLEALAQVCAAVRLPVLAIGGVTVERAADVARAGAAGVAAIGLFATGGQGELDKTVAQLRQAFASS